MIISKVAKLSMIDRLVYWIGEREKIRNAKESGKPAPWTDDEILQQYRFCNVRRMDDKVSRWLYENWYDPHFDHANMLPAVALARFINKPASLAEVEFPQRWNAAVIARRLRRLKDSGEVVFNAAYMVRGNDGQDKIESVVDFYVQPLVKHEIPTETMEEAHASLLPFYGMGSFMAGQIVADLRWAINGEWKDRNTWAPKGPGSHRGMNRLAGYDLKSPMSQGEFVEKLLEVVDHCEGHLPTEITERLEAMDYQNCMCEFDKYNRCLDGGSSKQKYPGTGR